MTETPLKCSSATCSLIISQASSKNEGYYYITSSAKDQVRFLWCICNHLSPHLGRLREVVTVPAFTLGYPSTKGLVFRDTR